MKLVRNLMLDRWSGKARLFGRAFSPDSHTASVVGFG